MTSLRIIVLDSALGVLEYLLMRRFRGLNRYRCGNPTLSDVPLLMLVRKAVHFWQE